MIAMSELTQKLHYKLDGVTDEISLYTTLDEVNNNALFLALGG